MPGFEVFGEEERKAVNELFDKNGGILFAHGFDSMRNGVYRVREFEQAIAKCVEAPYAQAVSSGTAALKVGLKALDVGPGDEVITQSFTFIATVEAILDIGATPVVVDIDSTLNMCPKSLNSALTEKTKVILPVHMMGAAADMDSIMQIAKKNHLKVLEDTAQAFGGTFKGQSLGTIGEIGTFSTDAGKTINTGEGGLVVCREEEHYIRARSFHDHGHEYSEKLGRAEERALIRGFNYRMTELQGAIGLAQLSKLDYILKQQRENKIRLKASLNEGCYKFRTILDNEGDIGDSVVILLDTADQAEKLVARMRDEGLGTKNLPDAIRWHFAGHWDHIFIDSQEHLLSDRWKQSAELLKRAVALPVMVNMTEAAIENMSTIVNRLIREL
jgi:8-amino-3,8-dideoxy-alpha-D-manno-octulosonate transaminase